MDTSGNTRATVILALLLALPLSAAAQTREAGPWWPAPHGPDDQAGASNYVTPEKILQALQIPRTGQTYELGHMYEASMPAYGIRPYYLNVTPGPVPQRAAGGVVHQDYFNGFIGQMGTQFDALSHMGRNVEMADGSIETVFYNGFTEDELTGANRGVGGVEALGIEHMKPFITRGILVDIAGYKGVPTLAPDYEVTLEDVLGALERQGMSEDTIEQGDAVLFHYGWSVNWTNPSRYNDSFVGAGDNEGSPGIGGDVARWLVTKRPSMVGGDSCCVQIMPATASGNVHHTLFFDEGIPLLENMELKDVAADEVYEFLFLNLTIRIKGATGSPVRPIAVR
ncbi:cyclase family protein [Candidatus Rariloculus sp.]|uniref:cyclase family protein n=1 Tax=Candidatus Rariloculus sp. TaxID=3101265 RepID=UPI003D15186D